MNVEKYYSQFKDVIENSSIAEINNGLKSITRSIDVDKIAVSDRVKLSNYVLQHLSRDQRIMLAKTLIQEPLFSGIHHVKRKVNTFCPFS